MGVARLQNATNGGTHMLQSAVSVLIVEDEVLISHLMADWLTESGFEVHEAHSADEALDYIDKGGTVDVLFTDFDLPGGMNGAELAKCARARKPELPVVYSSGRCRLGDFGPLAPDSMFVPKPYNPDHICRLLTQLTETVRH